ncbi:MAG: metallophosphoesterase, partial [Planctomycetes bacterium]|nr:metallophosphoesterase [Planctomycetota bacterium]
PTRGRRSSNGDSQCCKGELDSLLAEVKARPGRDRLLPVGDLVNRGPKSVGVLRLLKELNARPVLGNHDLHLLGVAQGKRKLSSSDTLSKVLTSSDAPELLTWLAQQPILRVHKDLYQIHAGLHPAWKTRRILEDALSPKRGANYLESTTFATRARYCNAEGDLPGKRVLRDKDGDPTNPRWRPWYEFYDPAGHNSRYVVYGHWAVMGIVDRKTTLGLDSGCVWGGDLTAYIPEEKLLVSVHASRAYSGNYRPR